MRPHDAAITVRLLGAALAVASLWRPGAVGAARRRRRAASRCRRRRRRTRPPTALPNRAGFAQVLRPRRLRHGQTADSTRSPSRWWTSTSSSRSRWPSSSATTSTDPNGRRTSRRSSKSPYKPLLDAGVKFYASLGNHDAREQRYYKLFNMDGKLYYSFKAPKQDVRFFALESTYPVPEQMTWLEEQLKNVEGRRGRSSLPSPALLVRQDARVRIEAARDARAAVHEVQRQRRLHRPRPHLRAHEAAEGHRLLRGRVGRTAQEGRLRA